MTEIDRGNYAADDSFFQAALHKIFARHANRSTLKSLQSKYFLRFRGCTWEFFKCDFMYARENFNGLVET